MILLTESSYNESYIEEFCQMINSAKLEFFHSVAFAIVGVENPDDDVYENLALF
jgi:hypothetical protein